MEQLDRRAESGLASPEEEALLNLLERLIKDYHDRIELPELPPHKMLAYLMEWRGLRQADLLPVFGSRSVASDVLNGKRDRSKAHIRKLADFFNVSPELFL
jgi:HTH-type transcriptional regulator/antitoxin HigA